MSLSQNRSFSSSSAESKLRQRTKSKKINVKISNKKASSSSSSKGKSISKYFQSKKITADPEQATDNVKVESLNDCASDDDFRSPIVIRQRNNLAWKINKTPKQKAKSKKGRCTKNSTIEIIKTNFDGGGENPEHLQMALALSKSQFEAEYGYEETTPDIAEVLQNLKPTNLERFGFKSDKSALSVENRRFRSGTTELSRASRVKNRFKYVTPILMLRTAEDRKSIIESKISLILQQPDSNHKKQFKNTLVSSKLETFSSEDLRIFNLDNIYEKDCFYILDNTLILPTNNYKCGCLLKDWGSIPGRDKSPERQLIGHPLIEHEQPVQSATHRSISPDLFGSDDDYDYLNINNDKHVVDSDSASQNNCSLKRPASFYSLEEFDEPLITVCDESGKQIDSVELKDSNLEENIMHSPIIISLEDSLSEVDMNAINSPAFNKEDDSPSDEILTDFRELEVLSKEVRSSACRRLSLDSNNSSKDSCIEILDDVPFNSMNNEQKNATPINMMNALSRSSNGYNSAELNVTDYVNNLLNKENFSFDQPCKMENACTENEELPLSQSSVLEDEELNYSSHFATPTRPSVQPIIRSANNLDLIAEEDNPGDINPPIISELQSVTTPNNYIVKTKNITPMPNYDSMNTPLICKELQKVGVKSLKRARGAKLLKYIYESTHPLVGSVQVPEKSDSDDEGKVIKRRKKMSPICIQSASSIDIIGDPLLENEQPDDLIFETKQSAKIPSCRVPLQIIWHNFVSCNPDIKENILLYEPLQLEELHRMLKQLGFKFSMQDLLTFLDKKCITIRTAQKSGKRHR